MSNSRSRSRTRSSSILMALKKPVLEKPILQCSTQMFDYDILEATGVIDEISHGFLARYKPTGQEVTLKMTDMSMTTDYELLQELITIERNARLCRHENILTHYATFVDNERLWSVTEPMRLGSLKLFMDHYYPEGIPSETVIATILREVLRAVSYLHENDWIHNNIRADSILLDNNGDVRLSGLHQLINQIQGAVRRNSVYQFAGYPEWMAPEVLSQATTYDQKVDIYSVGILALELMYGRTPYDQWPALKILLCKLHYEVPAIEYPVKTPSKAFNRFVERCLHKNPYERPTADELLDDAFVKQAKNKHYVELNLVKRASRKDDGQEIGSGSVVGSPTSTGDQQDVQ